MNLRSDIPDAAFYTNVRYGGLGLQQTALAAPTSIFKRASALKSSTDPIIRSLGNSHIIDKLLNTCIGCFPKNENCIPLEPSKMAINNYHATEWFKTIDGKGTQTVSNPGGTNWLSGHSGLSRNSNFCHLTKLRLGRLETKENCNRGRQISHVEDARCVSKLNTTYFAHVRRLMA